MRVAVLTYLSRTTPSTDPLPSAEMLASDLEATGHRTTVSVISATGLGAVSGTIAALTAPPPTVDSWTDVELTFVHGEMPVDVITDLRTLSAGRICLYGPFAGERFEGSGADFALVGPIRDAPAELVQAILSGLSAPSLRAIPRLLYRTGEIVHSSTDWTPPRFEDWSRARTEPRKGSLLVPSTKLPEGPRVGVLTLPAPLATDLNPNRSLATGPNGTSSAPCSTCAWPEQIHSRALPHRDPLWLGWAPRQSHANDLLDRPFSLLWDEGVRHFRLVCDNPFPDWSPWIEHLQRLGTLPKEVELSPSVEALAAAEPKLNELLTHATQLGLRIVFSRIPFVSFVDPSARRYGITRSHWETRAVARLLTQLQKEHPAHDLLSRQHQILLFDPWMTMDDFLDQLQAMDEDAPFLKGGIHLGSRLIIRSAHSPIAEQATRDGLLERVETGTGFRFRFADSTLAHFAQLYPCGLAPLCEAVGRMRLETQVHDETMIEARFRWARELAVFVQEDSASGPEADSWGRIVARVVQSLQVDRPRSTR